MRRWESCSSQLPDLNSDAQTTSTPATAQAEGQADRHFGKRCTFLTVTAGSHLAPDKEIVHVSALAHLSLRMVHHQHQSVSYTDEEARKLHNVHVAN